MSWFVRPLSAVILVGVASALVGVGVRPAFAQKAVSWSAARADAAPVKAGGPVTVDLSARIDEGWHLYALTQVSGGPNALVITVPKDQPFALSGPIQAPVPKTEFDPNFSIDTQFHADRAVFTLPLKVAAGTKDGTHKFRAVVAFQVCNDKICLPPTEEELTVEIPIGTPGTVGTAPGTTGPGTTSGTTPGTTPNTTPGPTPSTAPTTTSGTTPSSAAPVPDLAASSRANTLGAYIGLAALMGALSLLTPCVFPMVPITVSYFTNRAGRTRKEAITQALVYGLGIILTFSALGFILAIAFGASGLNRFAADPWLNLAVTGLFVAFALSLFGVWELAVPSKLLTAVSKADEGKGRFIGTALMGLAFTLTSFTCTAPFLGTLLVVAAQGDWQWPLAGMLAFSSIFALPFIGLAIAPHLISALPRSGS
ncbi:MAG TPA: cytochrome c biogenesis protein CcdA, partial [Vicinamibacterales bacterium]|nr:cytochrome c biogenesis protein CcdA [Vicinamibacterales bacterium]